MIYNFDETLDHRYDGSMRWKQPDGYDDYIGLGTADLDFFSPPCVKEISTKILEENTFNYRFKPEGYEDAIIRWYQRHFNLAIDRQWLFHVPGTLASIKLALDLFTKEGEGVLVQAPCFGAILIMLELSNFKIIKNEMIFKNDRYELDLKDFEEKIKNEKPKVFLMVNPHNPTGSVFSKEELNRMVQICYENDVKIISDEVHSLLLMSNKKHTPILNVSDQAKEISIQIVSMSKGYNLMSLPHAIISIADEKLRFLYSRTLSTHSFDYAVNSYAATAVMSVMNQADEWHDQLRDYLKENITYSINYCQKHIPELRVYQPEGGFLLWINCSSLNVASEQIEEWFEKNAHVMIRSGLEFGEEGRGFIRMNIAVTRANLIKAWDRINQAVHQ